MGAGPASAQATARALSLRRLRLAGPSLLALAAVLTLVDLGVAVSGAASVLLTLAWLPVLVGFISTVIQADPAKPADAGGRIRRIALHAIGGSLLVMVLAAKILFLALELREPGRYDDAYREYTVGALLIVALGILGRGDRLGRFLLAAMEHPARLMLLSFGITGLLGGFLLSLPPSLRSFGGASLVNSMFVAFSAVCVTGLSPVDVASTYTPFGQLILLALIQIGGIGIMVLSAALFMIAGKQLQVRRSSVLTEMLDAGSRAGMRRLVFAIVLYTLGFEAFGASVLYLELSADPALALTLIGPDGSVAWAAIFHAVSAFCNAGFTVFRGGTGPLRHGFLLQGTLAFLILFGGLGVPVLDELRTQIWLRLRRVRPPRLSLHARVSIATSAFLVLFGAAGLLACENGRVLAELSSGERVAAAFFHSVSLRTAGFATLDLGKVGAPTVVFMCAIMAIGASPGSTGGGLKTTTFATLVALLRSELRAERSARLFDRALNPATVRKAVALMLLGVTWTACAVFLLLAMEDSEPLALIFEAVSALSTTGLSMNATATLSVPGKLVVIATMLLGRIGPLTAVLAVARATKPTSYALAEERLVVG